MLAEFGYKLWYLGKDLMRIIMDKTLKIRFIPYSCSGKETSNFVTMCGPKVKIGD